MCRNGIYLSCRMSPMRGCGAVSGLRSSGYVSNHSIVLKHCRWQAVCRLRRPPLRSRICPTFPQRDRRHADGGLGNDGKETQLTSVAGAYVEMMVVKASGDSLVHRRSGTGRTDAAPVMQSSRTTTCTHKPPASFKDRHLALQQLALEPVHCVSSARPVGGGDD
jgi:hypothetical protein